MLARDQVYQPLALASVSPWHWPPSYKAIENNMVTPVFSQWLVMKTTQPNHEA